MQISEASFLCNSLLSYMLACELQLSVTSLQLRESARFQLGSLIQHPALCTMAWKLFEGSNWDNHRAHLICSSSLRDYRPTYSDPASFLSWTTFLIRSTLYYLFSTLLPALAIWPLASLLFCERSKHMPTSGPLSALAVCFLCWNALLPSIYIIHASLPSALC